MGWTICYHGNFGRWICYGHGSFWNVMSIYDNDGDNDSDSDNNNGNNNDNSDNNSNDNYEMKFALPPNINSLRPRDAYMRR